MKLVNFGCDGNPSLRISSDVINRIKSNYGPGRDKLLHSYLRRGLARDARAAGEGAAADAEVHVPWSAENCSKWSSSLQLIPRGWQQRGER